MPSGSPSVTKPPSQDWPKCCIGATLAAAIVAPIGLALKKSLDSGAANGLLVAFLKLRDVSIAVLTMIATGITPTLTPPARGYRNRGRRRSLDRQQPPACADRADVVSKIVATIGGSG
jgi:hypothetical protein